MANISDTDMAWAAGLFEGEGYIGRPPRRRDLKLGMTDRDVVEHFLAVMQCGRVQAEKLQARKKPSWRWIVSYWPDVERCGLALLPWLGSRRRERMEELLAHPAKVYLLHARFGSRGVATVALERGVSKRTAYRQLYYERTGN